MTFMSLVEHFSIGVMSGQIRADIGGICVRLFFGMMGARVMMGGWFSRPLAGWLPHTSIHLQTRLIVLDIAELRVYLSRLPSDANHLPMRCGMCALPGEGPAAAIEGGRAHVWSGTNSVRIDSVYRTNANRKDPRV